VVVEAVTRATHNGTEFAIIAGPPAVQLAFDVAGLTQQLPSLDVARG
jgi:hypothetical protein